MSCKQDSGARGLTRPRAPRLAPSGDMRASLAAPAVVPLLHGASGVWDDLAVFAAVVLALGAMIYLSWRAGKDKRKQKRAARKARHRR